MLDRFRNAQQTAVRRLEAMEAEGRLPAPRAGARPSFTRALRGRTPLAVIAEYKRASPSLGAINLAAEPEEVAAAYARAGAACISVLTEEAHFHGRLEFIERMSAPGLPLLRKDFLIHPLQVRESAATPASAILLIARMLDGATYAAMLREAETYGLETVLEIFDETDLERTRRLLDSLPARQAIIQVNNRNLQTLAVSDEPSQRLIRHKRAGETWISASGISSRDQVLERASLGFDAILVGGSLMAGDAPGQALAALVGPHRPEASI